MVGFFFVASILHAMHMGMCPGIAATCRIALFRVRLVAGSVHVIMILITDRTRNLFHANDELLVDV